MARAVAFAEAHSASRASGVLPAQKPYTLDAYLLRDEAYSKYPLVATALAAGVPLMV